MRITKQILEGKVNTILFQVQLGFILKGSICRPIFVGGIWELKQQENGGWCCLFFTTHAYQYHLYHLPIEVSSMSYLNWLKAKAMKSWGRWLLGDQPTQPVASIQPSTYLPPLLPPCLWQSLKRHIVCHILFFPINIPLLDGIMCLLPISCTSNTHFNTSLPVSEPLLRHTVAAWFLEHC